MPLFLVPIVAGVVSGGAAYGAMTQDEAGDYSADAGGRQLNAHQIYEQLRAGDNGSSLMTGRDSASTLKNSFGERIGEMDALASRMDEAWQGDSAEAAKAGAHPLKQWLEDSQIKLYESDNTMASQLDAFNTVMSQVQPVPAQPPESDFLNDITPWETDTDRAIQQYNAMAQANVEAYNAYYAASSSNAQSMPNYSTVDGEFGDVEVDGSGTGGGGGAGGGSIGGGPYPGGSVPSGSYPGGGGSYPGGGAGGGSIGGGPYPGGSVPSGSYPGGGGSYAGGGGPGYQYTPGQYDDSTSASNFTVPKTTVPDFSTGGGGYSPNLSTGGGPGGGLGPGGSGGGFSGAGGPGALGAGGAMGVGGAMGAAGPGAASGAAAPGASSGLAGRGAMGGAAAAGAGARGMGGMPMGAMGGAGGRGQGAEDEEHQRKYLIEEDGDSLFGSDELTAPPVIGE
ncbi:hypothetical protein [Saccharomonospora cyanea]|uniref:PPE family protein n=1 Tax=Saccharomonospora cyanea NA-134 TaxID=882082 RepID=H5XRK6_9PSEU|nr:hypothetical protein [Saccharomonospora cyanea]EHR63951.1 PPE family protein [Saccharomonospora cyanea NA-134]